MANGQQPPAAVGPLIIANATREVARAWSDGRIEYADDVTVDEMKEGLAYFMGRDLEAFAAGEGPRHAPRALQTWELANVAAISSSGSRVFVALTNNRVLTFNDEGPAEWRDLPPIPGTFVQSPVAIVRAGLEPAAE